MNIVLVQKFSVRGVLLATLVTVHNINFENHAVIVFGNCDHCVCKVVHLHVHVSIIFLCTVVMHYMYSGPYQGLLICYRLGSCMSKGYAITVCKINFLRYRTIQ